MTTHTAVIGIDLGGTSVRVGAITPQGRILAVRKTAIEARRGPQAGVERIIGLIHTVLDEAGHPALLGIGMGSTGPIDRQRGAIQNPYTLPTWEDVDICRPLQEAFGVPVNLENDADAAALGEYWCGAGQGVARLYAVTVGTGIGTAFLLNGEVYRGLDGSHPEGGHISIDPSGPRCYCGLDGCWEMLAAGPAIGRNAREALQRGEGPSQLLALAGGQIEQVEAPLVVEAAAAGDPLAKRILDRAARDTSLGLINIILFFVPDVIVLSGGVMNNAGQFLPAIQEVLARTGDSMVPATRVKIVPAALGDQAGLLGAAYSILRNHDHPLHP